MSGWVTFAAILLSLTGLAYLALTDPKRRRTHHLPSVERRRLEWPARLVVFGPGIYLILVGHWSGLAIWAGAVTTLGWVMAAITPATYVKLRTDVQSFQQARWAKMQELFQILSGKSASYVPDRISTWRFHLPRLIQANAVPAQHPEMEALKARITALEARLARLEAEKVMVDGTVEPPKPAEGPVDDKTPEKPLDAAE